jgi:hypothetical protein
MDQKAMSGTLSRVYPKVFSFERETGLKEEGLILEPGREDST